MFVMVSKEIGAMKAEVSAIYVEVCARAKP
jgi:hypothetical protein